MHTPSPSLKAKRQPMVQHPHLPTDDAGWSSIALPNQRIIVRRLRAISRFASASLWTLLALPIQSLLLLGPHWLSLASSQLFWRVLSRLIGLNVRQIGSLARRTADGRPVIYVCNHSSWLDILVLGGLLPAHFIAKEEIGSWPVISLVARLGRTLFVRRSRASTGRERDDMVARLRAGDNLILFPEGTTSDGSRVMPFRTAFLSIAEIAASPEGRRPIVQPISLVYDRLAGLPTGRATRPLFAWYGDMDIGSHFWRLAQHSTLRASVVLHAPLDPEEFANRKQLAASCWSIVAHGASALRQNRPVQPVLPATATQNSTISPAFV